MSATKLYSGIVINQNSTEGLALLDDALEPDSLVPEMTLFPSESLFPSFDPFFQVFYLPDDYARGTSLASIPALTGTQVLVKVTAGQQATASITWLLEVNDRLAGWIEIARGTSTGAAVDGDVWFNLYADRQVPVQLGWLTQGFRLSVGAYTGLDGFYYANPGPVGRNQLFLIDGEPFLPDGVATTLLFRVLATTADSGTDFLGNLYRSLLTKSGGENVATAGVAYLNGYWQSQPNPSYFGVEALYFNEQTNGGPTVIDRMTISPLTPGVYANVYYSNDPRGPGIDIESWDELLWTWVPETYVLRRRQTFAFPDPIVAKYIKIEFSNLQAKTYAPGNFEIPSTFRKFPKWVLDYYLLVFAAGEIDLMSSGVNITYDALDLAFSYYTADLLQSPDAPALSQALDSNGPATNLIDPLTLGRIKIAFQQYLQSPAQMAKFGGILANYVLSTATSNYSTEIISQNLADTSLVSNQHREALLLEKAFPAMAFMIPCRHGYRISQSMFANGIAYYAGVQEVAFHREIYTTGADQGQYNEALGDAANLERNDHLLPRPSLPPEPLMHLLPEPDLLPELDLLPR